jgi:predicted glycosyltransferase
MCYNTVAEIAAHRARAVVVPRTWRYGEHEKGNAAGIEWEQLLRARAIARLGLVDLVEPDALSPEVLAERIRIRRTAVLPAASGLDLGGLDAVTGHLLALTSATGERHGAA